jgi:hypothetical protein
MNAASTAAAGITTAHKGSLALFISAYASDPVPLLALKLGPGHFELVEHGLEALICDDLLLH